MPAANAYGELTDCKCKGLTKVLHKVANAKVPWKVLRKDASRSDLLKNLPQDLSQNLTSSYFAMKTFLVKVFSAPVTSTK